MFYTYESTLNKGIQILTCFSKPLAIVILLFAFGCQKEEDASAPLSIVSTNIVDGATEVDVFSEITVLFSEEMDASTVNENSFVVQKGQYPIYGKVSCIGKTAVFKPSQKLDDNTVYNCTLSIEAKAKNGSSMRQEYHWSFTSGEEPDLIAPTVDSHLPLALEELVFTDSNIQVKFSEVMDIESIDNNSFIVKNGDDAVSGTFVYEDKTVTFIPNNTLLTNTAYTCILTSDVKDLAGNKLANELEWSFNTVPGVIGFNDFVKPVFKDDNCFSCHNQNRAPDLREGYAYNSLINGKFVDVDNPEKSRILEMLRGDYHEGFTTEKTKRLIQEWIKQGAKNN